MFIHVPNIVLQCTVYIAVKLGIIWLCLKLWDLLDIVPHNLMVYIFVLLNCRFLNRPQFETRAHLILLVIYPSISHTYPTILFMWMYVHIYISHYKGILIFPLDFLWLVIGYCWFYYQRVSFCPLRHGGRPLWRSRKRERFVTQDRTCSQKKWPTIGSDEWNTMQGGAPVR